MSGLIGGVFAALDRRLDKTSRAPIALGLSGGGDSMALLLMAAEWAKARHRPLLALTVDHRLHPDSAAWTAFAGNAARNAGADWRALAWEGDKPTTGLPAAARAARHRLLADAAREAGAAVILLAHTVDDVLEGDAMRLSDAPRLGRLRDWSPSPVWPEGRGLFLLRPLLETRRSALRAWLRGQGGPWLDDPANDDPLYARARARASLTDAADAAPVDTIPDRPLPMAAAVKGDGFGAFRLSRDEVRQAAFSRQLLSLLVVCAAGAETPPRAERLERLQDRLAKEGAFVATLSGARIVAEGDDITIFREAGDFARQAHQPLHLSAGQSAVWDGRFEIAAEADLCVTSLAGLAARLPPAERARLSALPPPARAASPALRIGQTVRLPRPFGDGPAVVTSLVKARFDAAAGLIRHEGDINPACDGRTGMARGLQSSYVEGLAPA